MRRASSTRRRCRSARTAGSTSPRTSARSSRSPAARRTPRLVRREASSCRSACSGATAQALRVGERAASSSSPADGARRTIVRGLPYKEHQQDAIVAGPDGRLYLGSGSTCDACVETDPRSAAILSFRPDGTDLRVVASRAAQPVRARVRRAGAVRHGQRQGQARRRRARGDGRPRPAGRELRLARLLAELRAEEADRRVHAASRSRSPTSSRTPRRTASPLARRPLRRRVGRVPPRKHGRVVVRIRRGSVTTFATGFDHPLALAVDPSGDLLVADWGRGVIYAIRKP